MADVVAARLTIPVQTNAKKATTDLSGLDNSLKKTNLSLVKTTSTANATQKSLAKTGKAFSALKAAIPFVGLASVILIFKKIISVTAEQQKAEAQLNAVLKSTGQAAGLTAKELKTMASGLQSVTTFGDEAIIQAQSLLLTFTKIGSDVFPQATETILNMAEAMGTDLKSATIQVGKALNDPILGVTALRRVGVQLSASQEKLIKSFVKTGDIAKAQGIILGELETQFGGVARASAETLGGALSQLGNSAGDALETLGNQFSPALIDLADALKGAIGDGTAFSGVLEFIGLTINKTVQSLTVLIRSLSLVGSLIEDISNIGDKKGFTETASSFEKLKGSTLNLIGLGKETEEQNVKTASSFRKTAQATQASAKESEEAIKIQAKALEILEKAGDPSAFIERQRKAFEEQKKIVSKAGLDISTLEKFQQLQRQTQYDNFFKNIASNQQLSIEQRQQQLEQTLASIQEAENLSNQERLAAQEAYNQQSAVLEQQRFQSLANNVQLGADVLGGFNDIARNLSQVRQNQIASEIQGLEEQGASEEEIAQKRRKLQRKAAIDQKRFATVAAILDTATAITKALASTPPPASYALAAISAAKGATQLAVIKSQPIPAAQFGGNFEVPPGNEADSALLRVNQGEEISVTPAGETGSQGDKKQTLVIGGQEFEGYLVDSMQRILNSGKVNINRSGVVRTA